MKNIRYYIRPGAETKMFTLRVRYEELMYSAEAGENMEITRDEYIRNLSIDKTRAVDKAKEFATDGVLLSDADNLQDLEEIRRRESEEIRIEREKREAEYEAERKARSNALIDEILQGFYPFGVYRGSKIAEAPRSYAQFWLNLDNEDDDVVCSALQKMIASIFPMLVNLPKPNGNYIGEVKQRLVFTATMVSRFGFEGYYGWTDIAKYVTEDGESLTYMGSGSIIGNIGDKVTFKGTVKKHEEYKGENSTYVMRLAEVKPKVKKVK